MRFLKAYENLFFITIFFSIDTLFSVALDQEENDRDVSFLSQAAF